MKIRKELLDDLVAIENVEVDIYNSDECAQVDDDRREIINRICREYAEEIVELAYHNNAAKYDSVVFVDPADGELVVYNWTGNTYLSDESNLIEIYRLKQNWVGNGCWDNVNDILDNEEWNKLVRKYGDDADFLDDQQLESIGIDLDERLREYLVWCLEEF